MEFGTIDFAEPMESTHRYNVQYVCYMQELESVMKCPKYSEISIIWTPWLSELST